MMSSSSSSYVVDVGATATPTLEAGDNVVTAATVGAAEVGVTAIPVSPQSVTGKIAVWRNGCDRCFHAFKNKHKRAFYVAGVCNAVLNVSLYFLDVYTDIALLVTFVIHGWFWSSVGSITFIAVPYLVAMYGIVRLRREVFKDYKKYINFDDGEFSQKKMLFFLFSPILPLAFDIFLMPFHGFMGRYIGDNLSNFMTQYEATRTLSETILESIPQLCLEAYMVVYCRLYTCNFQAEEGGNAALMQALALSIASIVYRLVMTCFEMQRENLTLREYLTQLIRMGDGLPLGKIANNDIVELDVEFEMTPAQARLLAKVLESNTSLKRLDLQWKGLDEESRKALLATGHQGLFSSPTNLVRVCEEGFMEVVKLMVEGHDVEKTGMSVDEMVSKEGNNSRGYSVTPLQMAAKNEQLEIAKYLVKTCTTVDLIGQTNSFDWNSLHYVAWISKKDVQTLQFLIDNYNGKDIKDIINQKNNLGKTPLDYAYGYNDSLITNDIVALLRQYGGKANEYDKNGNEVGKGEGNLNILNKACAKGNLEELKTLINDGNGDLIGPSECLHYAAAYSKKDVQMLQLLVDNYDGDIKDIINNKNEYGYTPLDWAYKYNDSPIKKDIVALLRQYGGK